MHHKNGSFNQVILIGRLGQDIELKYTPNGTAVATISIATSVGFKTSDRQNQEKTEWSRVVVWGKMSEYLDSYAKKGNRIHVVGRLETRQWEDNNGTRRYMTEIQAEHISILESSQSSTNNNQGNRSHQNPPSQTNYSQDNYDNDSDDLPF